jgi:hypothetical protein
MSTALECDGDGSAVLKVRSWLWSCVSLCETSLMRLNRLRQRKGRPKIAEGQVQLNKLDTLPIGQAIDRGRSRPGGGRWGGGGQQTGEGTKVSGRSGHWSTGQQPHNTIHQHETVHIINQRETGGGPRGGQGAGGHWSLFDHRTASSHSQRLTQCREESATHHSNATMRHGCTVVLLTSSSTTLPTLIP